MSSTSLPLGDARRRAGTSALLKVAGSHLVLILGSLIMLFPFAWMVSISLGTQSQLFLQPPRWIPNPPLFGNYPTALTQMA